MCKLFFFNVSLKPLKNYNVVKNCYAEISKFYVQVRSTRIYVRDCTLISPYPLLLFGGEIHVQHVEQVLSVDDRISYKAYAKTGVIFKELRRLLDELLATKLNNAAVDISSECL